MEIEKKTWPEYFQKVLEGRKKFEIRLADFDVNEGDVLVLKEYDNDKKEYTGRELRKKVDFVTKFNPLDAWDIEEIKEHGLCGIGISNENEDISLSLRKAQKLSYSLIEEVNKKNSVIHKKEGVFPHVVEEVGELAREINHYISDWREKPSKERLAEEMVDVIGQVLILATDYGIDVEEEFEKKIAKLRKRFELD